MFKNNSRSDYFDTWKGIAIIAVVAIHASNNTLTFDNWSFNWSFGVFFRQLIDFAVPLFFSFAGMFSVSSINGTSKSFYLKRLKRIATPYLIWTLLYSAIHSASTQITPIGIIKNLLLGTGIGIGYFVVVLLQFSFLTPIYNRIAKLKTHVWVIIIGTMFGCLYNYHFSALHPDLIPSKFPFNGLLFFSWYPFYHLGYVISRYKNTTEIPALKNNKILLFALAIAVVLSIIEGFFWAHKNNYSFSISQLKISSFSFSLILITLIIKNKNNLACFHHPSFLSWLGSYSYCIYLTHMIFLQETQKYLKAFIGFFNFQPAFIIGSSIITISLCFLLIKLVEKVPCKRISLIILAK